MVKGANTERIHPEHEKQLRDLGMGGLTQTPRKWLPSQQVPPLPFVEDEYGSELTKGDKVLYDGEIHWVDSVDVSAKTVDIGLDEPRPPRRSQRTVPAPPRGRRKRVRT